MVLGTHRIKTEFRIWESKILTLSSYKTKQKVISYIIGKTEFREGDKLLIKGTESRFE